MLFRKALSSILGPQACSCYILLIITLNLDYFEEICWITSLFHDQDEAKDGKLQIFYSEKLILCQYLDQIVCLAEQACSSSRVAWTLLLPQNM